MRASLTQVGVQDILDAASGYGAWHSRVVVVLVCYLDDSGTEKDSPILIMAGYVALGRQWQKFERKASSLFKEYGVKLLHAKDFHHNKAEFSNWTINKLACPPAWCHWLVYIRSALAEGAIRP